MPTAARPVNAQDKEQLAWDHYVNTLQEIEQKRASMPTQFEVQEEFEKAMQRIEAGDAGPDRGYTSRFNVATDYELKAGMRHFDQNLRTRRLAALRLALPAGETRLVDKAVRSYVTANALAVEAGSPEWLSLAEIFFRAEIEALERSMEFDVGLTGRPPQDSLIKPPAEHSRKLNPIPLWELFDAYIVSRQQVGYHRDGGASWRPPIEALIKFLGHDDARRITQKNLIDWRDALLASGASANSVADKYLAAIRAVLRWSFANARIDTDVTERVKQEVPTKVQSREKGFTDDEAVLVLKASLGYQPKHSPNLANRESAHITAAKRWVPILCAFTGARVTEMTQLRKEDLRQEKRRWIIRISPDAGSVKTKQYRDVPVHRQVEALGFIDFVRSAGKGPLFHRAKSPEKYLAHARTTSGRLSQWLNELKLVPKGVAPNHGWRHRFKTLGRELGMSDRVLDALQGHSSGKEGDNYGDVTMKARLKMIDALEDYDCPPSAPLAQFSVIA